MALLATQMVNRAGTIVVPVAASAGGDTFTPDRHTKLRFVNASGGSITITVVTPRTDGIGNAVADNTIVVAAGTTKEAGPWPAEYYADPTTGLASITYSGVTSLTVAATAMGQP